MTCEAIEQFLKICDRHDIRPGFTFFDDCWNHKDISLNSEPPVDGRHNGRWAALQDAERKDENLPKFKAYVQDVIRAHAKDPRVLWWETYNEPNTQDAFTVKVRELAYEWAKELKPMQPVIACWNDHEHTDIVNAHYYDSDTAGWDRKADLNPNKGAVFTEAGARWYGKKFASNMGPIDVIEWLKGRQAAGKTVPGVYLCWELMAGNSNCRWFWGMPDGAPEPAIPWCGLLWPDATPVSYAEAEAVRAYATGESRALFTEGFASIRDAAVVPGWNRFPNTVSASSWLELCGQSKMVAAAGPWKDFLLEGVVMLKRDSGSAGLCFRVNDPGPGADQMRGYYVGFDRKTLCLGRMENNWQPLATVDLTTRGNKVELDTWNLVRVAVQGSHMRVWFNPLHDQTGPALEFTDPGTLIESGGIGCRVQDANAWFDDLVVLPLSALTPP